MTETPAAGSPVNSTASAATNVLPTVDSKIDATTGKYGAIGEFMKCMKRGDIMGVEQLARVSYDRDRLILHRALAHGRPRMRTVRHLCIMGFAAIRPPWIPCLRILLNLPGITETFSCLYEGKSITSLASCLSREPEAADVMRLLFEAGADPNGVEGEETHPFIYSQSGNDDNPSLYSNDLAKVFLAHPKFNLEKADLSKIFVHYFSGNLELIFSNTTAGKATDLLGLILKRLDDPDNKENFKNAVLSWAINFGPAAKFLLSNSLCTPDELFGRGLRSRCTTDTVTIALDAGAKMAMPKGLSYHDLFRAKNEALLSLLIEKGFPFPDMGEVACQSTEVWNLFKSRGFEYQPSESTSYDRPTVTQKLLERGDFDEAMRIKGDHDFPLPWAKIIKEYFHLASSINLAELQRYLDAAPSGTNWNHLISYYISYRNMEPLRACVARATPSQLSPDFLHELLLGAIRSKCTIPIHFEKISFVKSLGAQIDTETVVACLVGSLEYQPQREVLEPFIDDLFISLSREQKEGAANKVITTAVEQNIMWVVEKVAKLNEGRLPEGILVSAPSDGMFRLLASLGAVLGPSSSIDYFTSKSRELEAAIGKFILEHPLEPPEGPLPEEGMEEYDNSLVHYMASELRLPILKALLATGWNANMRDPHRIETPIRAVLSLPVSENDCRLQREVALELVSGGAKVTVDDLIRILSYWKLDEEKAQKATPDSIYFAFTRFSQHRIDTLTAIARSLPNAPSVLLSSAESSSRTTTIDWCPNLLWAACLFRNTTVMTSVVSLLCSAASSLSDLESVRGREEQTITEEAARKKEQARVMMGALVGQRREKDGLTVIEFLTKKGCFDCLNALNSALLLL